MVENIFKFLITFTNALFNLLNSPSGIIWGILIFLTLHTQMIKASPVSQNTVGSHSSLNTMMESLDQEKSFLLYAVESYDAMSFTVQVKEVKEGEFYGVNAACDAISSQHELCLEHPASCQSAKLSMGNFEETIKIRTHSLVNLKHVCELPEYTWSEAIISRCHQGLKWNPEEDATKKFSFFTSMFEGFTMEYLQQERGTRVERFVFSTPILIGSAIGAASLATAGITAAVIADHEVQGVVEAEKVHREEDVGNALHNNYINLNLTGIIAKDLDNIRQTEAWSSLSGNSVSQAKSSSEVINHLFSRSKVFEFSDPQSEEFYSAIGLRVSKNAVGLTTSEAKESTRLSAELTSLITTAVSTSSSKKCDDTLLIKTLVTPIINHRSRMEVSLVDGRLVRKYGNHSTYILLSQDAVVSKKTKMFGQDIHVVGRVCTIHNSVNASSTTSNDALFEEFTLQFEGNMTIIETCPLNGTTVSQNWTFAYQAKLKLPLVCSIQSEKVNCDAIKFQSSKVKEIHLTHYRMEVLEQHLEEEKINVNSTVFIRSNIELEEKILPASTTFLEKMKWPIIGSLVAIASLISMGLLYV